MPFGLFLVCHSYSWILELCWQRYALRSAIHVRALPRDLVGRHNYSEEVALRYHADDSPLFDHRNTTDPVIEQPLGHLAYRRIRADSHNIVCHHIVDRQVGDAMVQVEVAHISDMRVRNAIDIAFCHYANELPVGVDHWQPPDALLAHQSARFRQGHSFGRDYRRIGHPLSYSVHSILLQDSSSHL